MPKVDNKKIKNKIVELDLTLTEISKFTKISLASLSRKLNAVQEREFTANELMALAICLGVNINELYTEQ